MANLWWITVTLTFFLSAGCLAEVNKNKLATLIDKIRALKIHEGRIYSVAVSIHNITEKKAEYKIKPKFLPKEADITNINVGQVYSNNRLVAAIPHGGQHAEWRVLKELLNRQNVFQGGDLLVIFSSASPCGTSCANEKSKYNILGMLSTLTLIEKQKINPDDKTRKKWTNYAFVFEKVFKPAEGEKIDEGELKAALKNIGKYFGGLANVFRCYDPKANTGFQCVSCSSRGEVIKQCVDYDA